MWLSRECYLSRNLLHGFRLEEITIKQLKPAYNWHHSGPDANHHEEQKISEIESAEDMHMDLVVCFVVVYPWVFVIQMWSHKWWRGKIQRSELSCHHLLSNLYIRLLLHQHIFNTQGREQVLLINLSLCEFARKLVLDFLTFVKIMKNLWKCLSKRF